MDARRQLTRQYKEAGPQAGVFVIRNLAEGRAYVGASANVQGALNRARFELRHAGHRNRQLAAEWQRLGEAQFSFEVADVLKKKDEPGFDAKAELEALRDLWREELNCTPSEWLS